MCDNMLYMPCPLFLLALCRLVWFPCFCLHLFLHVHACLCLFVCVIKHCSYLWFHAGSHPSLYMKSQVPLLGPLLVGMRVVHNRQQIQTYISPLWIESLCVSICSHALFICMLVYMLSSFACLLCISCLLCVLAWLLHVMTLEHTRNL